jgi:hypothetical protein
VRSPAERTGRRWAAAGFAGRYRGPVLTQPDDLAEGSICGVLQAGWGFTARSVEYQAVGFGSHHWLAADARGARLFVMVDDLSAKLRTVSDTTDAVFGRLDRAFSAALSLRADAGLEFVVAPVPAAGGQVLLRLQDRYSVVVHPFVAGRCAGEDGEFRTGEDRRTVLGLLTGLHGARAAAPDADDFVVPHRDELAMMMGQTGQRWDSGPYAERARDLLAARAGELEVLLAAYDSLAARVAARPDRMVVTHGEPYAGNVIVTAGGPVLVDWDTVLLAPPERDLWDLARHDESLLPAYSAATGADIDQDALSLYRLWYDLAEISGYLSLFRGPHGQTADTAESWKNLRHFLKPAERWPALCENGTAQQSQPVPDRHGA